jgi:hypothetical protein
MAATALSLGKIRFKALARASAWLEEERRRYRSIRIKNEAVGRAAKPLATQQC